MSYPEQKPVAVTRHLYQRFLRVSTWSKSIKWKALLQWVPVFKMQSIENSLATTVTVGAMKRWCPLFWRRFWRKSSKRNWTFRNGKKFRKQPKYIAICCHKAKVLDKIIGQKSLLVYLHCNPFRVTWRIVYQKTALIKNCLRRWGSFYGRHGWKRGSLNSIISI